MIVPARAQLPISYRGSRLGYRILNLDLSVFSSFTTKRVEETQPGMWVVNGGVEAPDAGGYIVWGLKGKDIVGATIQPQCLPSPGITAGEAELIMQRFIASLPKPPAPVAVNIAPIESSIAALNTEFQRLLQANDDNQSQQASVIAQQVSALRNEFQGINAVGVLSDKIDSLGEITKRLSALDTTAQQLTALDDASRRFDEMSSAAIRSLNANTSIEHLATIAGKLEVLHAEIQRMSASVAEAQRLEMLRQKSIAVMEEFLEKVATDETEDTDDDE